jgi:phosphocarrier protein
MGLHARPAAMLVQVASAFESEVVLEKDGEAVNCKSMMGVLMLSAGFGSSVKVTFRGPDAAAAHVAVKDLFERKFGE